MKFYRLLLSISILFILGSCSQEKHNESIKSDQSLALATQIIENYTTQEYNDLKSKLFDPTTSERAKIWYSNAEMIKNLTTDAYSNIDSCFKFCKEDNLEKSKSHLLEITGKYKESILQVNTEIWQSFRNEFATLVDSTSLIGFTTSKSNKEFQNKIHNSISLIANRTISFCNLMTSAGCILRYEKFSVLIGQNSKHFKAGEKIEITAGVGSFSSASQPNINIDNQIISINDLGYAEFKKVLKGDTGRHVIPLTISYYSPDGIKKTTKHEIEYYIDQ